MNKIQLIFRSRNYLPNSASVIRLKSSSSSSSSDEEIKNKNDQQTKADQALKKLNDLLNVIVQEKVAGTEGKLDLAKPTNKRKPKEERGKGNKVEVESDEVKMVKAVKTIAEVIGGDVKQTESELLQKLLSPAEPKEGSETANLTNIIKGLKIDREKKPVTETRADQIRKILQRTTQQRKSAENEYISYKRIREPRVAPGEEVSYERVDLFNSARLGIFNVQEQSQRNEGPETKTYQKIKEKEMKLAVTHPPANYFQEMILWTEQGKIWQFPIDNEQGMEREQSIYFTEHIFLEKHLEPWCPPKGPLRHYMELVCVGLSKNPYLTVEAKKEHIEWYRKYFEEKKQLLQETGVLQGHTISNPKSIEG